MNRANSGYSIVKMPEIWAVGDTQAELRRVLEATKRQGFREVNRLSKTRRQRSANGATSHGTVDKTVFLQRYFYVLVWCACEYGLICKEGVLTIKPS